MTPNQPLNIIFYSGMQEYLFRLSCIQIIQKSNPSIFFKFISLLVFENQLIDMDARKYKTMLINDYCELPIVTFCLLIKLRAHGVGL